MATDIVIPEVGESITSGVIASWTVADGDWVDRDDTVLELETDKITMEVPAPASGVVKHNAAEGDEVDVGAVVGQIDESAEKPSGGSSESAKTASKQADGDGSSSEQSSAAATAVKQAQPRVDHGESDQKGAAPPSDDAPSTNGDVRATPLARKLAAERGIDLAKVTGTGAGSRIREQDVLSYLEEFSKQVDRAASTSAPKSDKPAARPAAGDRSARRESMSPLRQRVAQRLVEAQQTAAMLTTFNECDMTNVMALRKKHKESFAEKHGVNLGFMSFFVKAVVGALQSIPKVNAYIVEDEGKAAIEYHDYCDVAIAVASPKGLVVPVLRNAESMSFAEIESTIKGLAVRAKEGKLGLNEITGGTFTITNGGIFGSLNSTPILNPPQSAILGMHTIKNRPIEDPDNAGQVAIRPMMYLAVSYDHRIIDGAEAVRFLVAIKDGIEDPARLMLDL